MERLLFSRLWEEIDFDDHPHDGGHGADPEGEFTFTYTNDSIYVADARLSFLIGNGDGADSIHRWTTESVQMNEGPERMGIHRWSLSPSCLSSELSNWVIQHIGNPIESVLESVSKQRELLTEIRERISPYNLSGHGTLK